jgi:hypothetical protein
MTGPVSARLPASAWLANDAAGSPASSAVRKCGQVQRITWITVVLTMTLSLSGCVTEAFEPMPTATALLTALPLPTLAPTETRVPAATATISRPTPTNTPLATLAPQQAAAVLLELLRVPQCLAPCFWGITPRQTTFEEAQQIFGHYGLALQPTTADDDIAHYAIEYEFESGLSIVIILGVQTQQVSAVRVLINPAINESANMPREWQAYSPETLIQEYGPPSRVEFWGGSSHEPGADLALHYLLSLYFDSVDLIVTYNSAYDFVKFDPTTELVRVCPLTDQFQVVRIWLGRNPEQPPLQAVPIEEAASLNIQEFSALLSGELGMACFEVNGAFFSN